MSITISKEDDLSIRKLAAKLREKLSFTAPELVEEKIVTALTQALQVGMARAQAPDTSTEGHPFLVLQMRVEVLEAQVSSLQMSMPKGIT